MAHFYITLPSNSSMHYYPDNVVTRYTTRLANHVSLTGDWEVGLVEIQYQRTWYNLEHGEGRVIYAQSDDIMNDYSTDQYEFHIPAGYYNSPTDLLRSLNEEFRSSGERLKLAPLAKFTHDPITNRVNAVLEKGVFVHLSQPLRSMLGFSIGQTPLINIGSERLLWEADKVCDLNRGLSAMFVYCNVLEHVPVGDTKAPILRIVPVSRKHGDIVHNTYEKPLYVPLQQKNFDSIEIDIRTDAGTPVPFEYGKVLVTLHFRHSKIPYLLQ
jgi:hypothetical protein